MRSERGQASVEWIGIVLLVAIALAALSQLAPRADGRETATAVLHSITCAAGGRCERPPDADARREHRRPGERSASPAAPRPAARQGFAIPPLMPRPGETWGPGGPRPGRAWPGRLRLRVPELPALPGVRRTLARTRRGAGLAWRRAWLGCLAYERFRYAFLHPESRFPGYRIPPDEVLRMANDCISPVDLVRDWPLITQGRAGAGG
jgi:hypothetical protein